MASDGLKNLSRTMPEDETDTILEDLERVESDRGAALLGCSTVEYALRFFLSKHMVDLSASEDGAMFSNSGPLADLGGRISIAYALGLIDEKMRHDLLLMKDIRNVFGHAPRRITFERPEIATRCARFHSLKVYQVQPDTPRKQYVGASKALFIMLKFFGGGQNPGPPFGLPHLPYCKLAPKRQPEAPTTDGNETDKAKAAKRPAKGAKPKGPE